MPDFGEHVSEQTGGTLAVISGIQLPDTGPPLHVHGNDDELFLIVEGHYSFYADGRWTEVGAGGVVYFPRGTVHCFRNIGTTPGRHLILTTPAGFERFLTRRAEELAKPGGPDSEQLAAIAQDYGATIFGDGVA